MENIVAGLKNNLISRRTNEAKKIVEMDQQNDKELILIASGKIIELDFLIRYLDEMLHYLDNTKNIFK
jgi:hypothetical protein